jgi:AcrR family transcriptional regulator
MTARQAASEAGRVQQRRRTRRAIVEATMRLLARQPATTPSVAEIAAEAEVSRRTVYMYFPTLEQLLLDATLGALGQASIDPLLDDKFKRGDARARVEALTRAMLAQSGDTLDIGRRMLRLTVEAPAPAHGPKRGYRLVQWIERALEPLGPRLSREQNERLVSALAVVLGWEARIALRDVRALDQAAEARVIAWSARALVDAMLAEARSKPARRR